MLLASPPKTRLVVGGLGRGRAEARAAPVTTCITIPGTWETVHAARHGLESCNRSTDTLLVYSKHVLLLLQYYRMQQDLISAGASHQPDRQGHFTRLAAPPRF